MYCFVFIVFWVILSTIVWYSYHILNKINECNDDPSFIMCLILLPFIIICFIYEFCFSIHESKIGDRIKARLDKFFGI